MEEKDEKGFTIRDHRTASEEHSPQAQNETTKQRSDPEGQKPAETVQTEGQQKTAPPPELDFSSFIISLATTAQVSLGTIPNPQTGQPQQSLPVAKQMIDILGMLKEKTKGNLSKEEEPLLDSALFNLRMQYVRAAEGKK